MSLELFAVRAFEIIGFVSFFLGLRIILKTREPFYLGLYLACAMLFVWEWIQNSAWFFNLVFSDHIVSMFSIQGVQLPLSMPFIYGMYFGLQFFVLHRNVENYDRRFGRMQYPLLYGVSAVLVMIFEGIAVNSGYYTYYHHPQYELFGVPWSQTWFSANIVLFGYVLTRLAYRWSGAGNGEGFSLRSDNTYKGLFMGASAVLTGFFFAFSIQLIWYAIVEPGIVGVRPF